jgi:hypothetical protein
VVRIYSGANIQWCGFTVVRISIESIFSLVVVVVVVVVKSKVLTLP